MAGWPQASSSLPGFSYSPRQAVVSAPSKTTNQLRYTQTNRMDIGANNERLTQASSSLPGFSYSPRQAVVSAPSKTTNQLRYTQTNRMGMVARAP
ncbi:hypothetical protein Aeroheme_00197 [Aeromonas sp. DSM 116730]